MRITLAVAANAVTSSPFWSKSPGATRNRPPSAGQVVSVSFKVKAGGGGTISNVRIGIVQLATGSEDSFVSDIVSAWNAAGSDPSLNVGWTYANTPANLALTTSYQTFKVENITMGSLGNAGIFIWVDDTDAAAGEFVFIADVQLEVGCIVNSLMFRLYARR